jgi:hypothetical protein
MGKVGNCRGFLQKKGIFLISDLWKEIKFERGLPGTISKDISGQPAYTFPTP